MLWWISRTTDYRETLIKENNPALVINPKPVKTEQSPSSVRSIIIELYIQREF